jgi:hypothetical protein
VALLKWMHQTRWISGLHKVKYWRGTSVLLLVRPWFAFIPEFADVLPRFFSRFPFRVKALPSARVSLNAREFR